MCNRVMAEWKWQRCNCSGTTWISLEIKPTLEPKQKLFGPSSQTLDVLFLAIVVPRFFIGEFRAVLNKVENRIHDNLKWIGFVAPLVLLLLPKKTSCGIWNSPFSSRQGTRRIGREYWIFWWLVNNNDFKISHWVCSSLVVIHRGLPLDRFEQQILDY